MIQTIITIIIIAFAVGYSVYKLYKNLTKKENPCAGCKGCGKTDHCNKVIIK